MEDNIRKWTGLESAKSQRAVENKEKWRKLVAKIICGAPTTLVVKGYMIQMSRCSILPFGSGICCYVFI